MEIGHWHVRCASCVQGGHELIEVAVDACERGEGGAIDLGMLAGKASMAASRRRAESEILSSAASRLSLVSSCGETQTEMGRRRKAGSSGGRPGGRRGGFSTHL